ncbi:DUF368 domain-containing protein [Priestia taiwanensis]|uniref:DUF368 domain-containing protein n=1 Tax=Priestia taiwanensis TaxID=1347902 RepID=A0A917AU45_9BACI|nr:DUF368 domain-containing protein [Priestia taiwanensis]MBM7364294.1 putative membrane protein [Priestia taiwanensis]GGE73282.1 DUF368 domain-containing protein [Priestia taiwanensis]
MEWKNLYRGLLMGISDLIPGVSGGTIAVVLGIYDRLLDAINGFFSKDWKRHLGFLIPLGIGVGAALLALSRVISYLLEYHKGPTQFFFLGLIVGVIPLLWKEADAKNHFKVPHFMMIFIGTVLVASMAFFTPDKTGTPITELTIQNGIGLFFAGWLASMAMLLPGVSGSFVLLLIGVYPTAINALSTFNIPLIAVIGAGVIVGFIVSSRGIRFLMVRYGYMTYAAIIGLVLGSLAVIFPGFAMSTVHLVASVITFVAGITIVTLLGKQSK